MPSFVTPKRGVQFIFPAAVIATSDHLTVKTTPTLAAGDAMISKDFGTFAQLATTPTEEPSGSGQIKVTLSTTEMEADNITVRFKDAAGGEWDEVRYVIQTSARQIDDLAFPTTSGRSIDTTATGAVGIDWSNVENKTATVDLTDTTIQSAGSISVTQVAASLNAPQEGSTLNCVRGATFNPTIPDLPSNTGYDELWFRVKDDKGKTNAQSIIAIKLSAPPDAGDGLKYLSEAAVAAPVVAGDGSLTVNSATSITVLLKPEATGALDLEGVALRYDLWMVDGTTETQLTEGDFVFRNGVTGPS